MANEIQIKKNNNAWRVGSDGVCHHIPTHMALVPVEEVVATATASKQIPKTHHRISEWVKTHYITIVGITTIVSCYILGSIKNYQERMEFLNSILEIATR